MISSASDGSSGRRASARVGIVGKLRKFVPKRQRIGQDASAIVRHPDDMTRAERTANLIGVVLPFVGVLVAIVLLWNRAVDVTDLAILAVGYAICGFGITVGY